jgi:hypothetical protein
MLLFERRSIAFATAFFIAGIVGVYWAAADLGFGFFAPFAWAAATVLCVAVVFGNAWVCRITRAWPTRTLGLMTYPPTWSTTALVRRSSVSVSLRR